MVPFLGPKWPICTQQKILVKTINITFIYQSSESWSRVMRMHHFWAQNGPFAQKNIFSENLLTNLVPFIYAYLHSKNQSQMLMY